MRWVKLTLAPEVRASWLFRICLLISSSFAGMVRTLVAVGTPRLASMLRAILDAAPRSGTASAASVSVTRIGTTGWGVPFDPADRPFSVSPDAGAGGASGGRARGGAGAGTGAGR